MLHTLLHTFCHTLYSHLVPVEHLSGHRHGLVNTVVLEVIVRIVGDGLSMWL